MKNGRPLIGAFVMVCLCGAGARGQEQPVKTRQLVPLKVQIVVSRYEGEKKTSSLPYTLTVNANDGHLEPDGSYRPFHVAQLRTGAKVPIPSIAPPQGSPIPGGMGPVTYQAIGTNIDCTAQSLDDGRFAVSISIEDTSVYADGKTAPGVSKIADIPSFRTFQSSNTVILKDGQSSQFTLAADKISGEVTKVDVTVLVVK
jgi:hypothetical protein